MYGNDKLQVFHFKIKTQNVNYKLYVPIYLFTPVCACLFLSVYSNEMLSSFWNTNETLAKYT